jgi:signal transduction histidine kinase
MPRSLYAKLALTLLALFTVLGLLFAALMHQTFTEYQDALAQEVNRNVASQLAREIEPRGGDPADFRARLDKLMQINPELEIYLLDPAGEIVAFSAHPSKVVIRNVDLAPVKTFVDGRAAFPIRGEDPCDPGRPKVFSAAAVPFGDGRVGYVYAVLRGKQVEAAIMKQQGAYLLRQTVATMVAAVALATVFGAVIFRLVTGKLNRLAGAMDAFNDSAFRERVLFAPLPPTGKADEVDRVAATYNKMVERITDQMRELHHQDSLRRDLVASVSHDLRTPLASLRGYLETLLLKGDALAPEQRRLYLETAVQQAERLGRLISGLFELAKLESRDVAIEHERFPVSELLQDVRQQYALDAENRGIRLALEVERDLPFVGGDIGLIERVLENLLENALRHTPAGGTVTMAARRQGDAVAVSVADTGSGISRDHLARVFDRFFRGDKSRDARSGGSGLGLAIAKRIIDLHGGAIQAESEPGQGTTFSFWLPVNREPSAAAA